MSKDPKEVEAKLQSKRRQRLRRLLDDEDYVYRVYDDEEGTAHAALEEEEPIPAYAVANDPGGGKGVVVRLCESLAEAKEVLAADVVGDYPWAPCWIADLDLGVVYGVSVAVTIESSMGRI